MIVLIGFMGSGKTTVARMLAARLGLPYVDTDAAIERHEGRSIADIFRTDGEDYLRSIERTAVAGALAGHDAVVSLGGGSVMDPDVRSWLQPHVTVWLDVEPATAAQRAGADPWTRPLLVSTDPVALYAERRPVYEEAADVTVDTTNLRPEEVAGRIAADLQPDALAPRVDGTRRIVVRTGGNSYPVTVGSSLTADIETHAELPGGIEKAFVVTHPELAALAEPVTRALEGLGIEVALLEIAAGEGSKSLATAGELYGRLAALRAHRNDLIVTLGGGVVGDVGGFVASTYMRGLRLVHIPTTLLAQVDAAVGGKTGLNLESGKNLVGTFYQPHAVLCDVDLLASCPDEEIRSGLAEVAKYGFIADPSLLGLILGNVEQISSLDKELLVEIVSRSIAIKASIVSTDERESGDRAFLNYGHTFGHAIEAVRGFGGLRHGEAVALGMMAAAFTAAELGRIDASVVDLHRSVLAALGLPVSGEFTYDELADAWSRDKKFDRVARFVLLRDIGRPEAGVPVEADVLRGALDRLARED